LWKFVNIFNFNKVINGSLI